MALLVAEATLPPGGAVLILMVSIVSVALTAVVSHKLHFGLVDLGMLGGDPHCDLVERGAF